ncbi:hypothetical protein FVW20_00290 [Desulfovibrio oxamicus]|uniref:Uncharacterized protein n=1 Tax=Nitratidesulfovibrio oxamicus TaxID=32016 RepID=A0ABS0J156_9BACT|nr:hypothetical protein [Nitratidesulfovibrio oxamicus]MBG3875503.1 hypothetical protein [Nitratidesulfovibrio oxamicus]
MTPVELIALLESGLRLGLTAAEMAQRLCAEQGGYTLPTIEEYEAATQELRDMPDLTPASPDTPDSKD